MKQRRLGEYVIDSRLATGGMAEVYVAHRPGPHGFKKRVALKRILPQYCRDPDYVAMFIGEARLAAQLDHPNVVQVFDFGESDGQLFLAMELVSGTTVHRLLRTLSVRQQALPLDLALHIASQTAHALDYAHRLTGTGGESLRVVHRDVSPANILLTTTGHVKLGDFGIARIHGGDLHTDNGQVRGKLGYMSPEQVTGKPLDGRSDVFTLATVTTEMVIGEPLFGRGQDIDVLLRIRDGDLTPLADTKRQIPSDVMRALHAGLSTRREDRPTASAFAAALDAIISKRGMFRGTGRLAQTLRRLELVSGATPLPKQSSRPPLEQGALPTHVLDTRSFGRPRAIAGARASLAPAQYTLMPTTSQHPSAPVSFPRLVQLLTSGEIESQTKIAKGDGNFVPLNSLPELARFVTSPALTWRSNALRDATRRGGLGKSNLINEVHGIMARHDTGVLHLVDGRRRKKIYFVEGRPDFVASNDRNELLGEYLVRHGVCLKMEVDMALALLSRYDGRLGDALVGLGVLRPVELFHAISGQVRSRYLEAFRWESGDWCFVADERSEEETIPFERDTCELLRDACLATRERQVEAVIEPIRNSVVRRNPTPSHPVQAYRLPAAWNRVLAVPGDSTVAAVIADSQQYGILEKDIKRALFLGVSCELLQAA